MSLTQVRRRLEVNKVLMADQEETAALFLSPLRPPGVAETIEYDAAASGIVQLLHAKERFQEVLARNAELRAQSEASAAEQEDQYYALQRCLDDNYLRISEFEKGDLK